MGLHEYCSPKLIHFFRHQNPPKLLKQFATENHFVLSVCFVSGDLIKLLFDLSAL